MQDLKALEGKSLAELREIAKALGITNVMVKKRDLIAKIAGSDSTEEAPAKDKNEEIHQAPAAAAEPALAVPLEKLMSCNSCKCQMLWPGCPKISYILEFIIWKKGGIQFRDQIETLIIDRKQINILAVEI